MMETIPNFVKFLSGQTELGEVVQTILNFWLLFFDDIIARKSFQLRDKKSKTETINHY